MKNTYTILFLLVVVIIGALYFLMGKKEAVHNNENMNEQVSGVIWKGLGFEPGFYFEIGGMQGNSHKTKLAFQNDGQVEGDLAMLVTPGVAFHVNGDMMVGGDAAVPIDLQITEQKCMETSGEEVDFSVTIKYADQVYTGCAEKINQ